MKTEAQKICFLVLSEGISLATKNKGNRMRNTIYNSSSKFRTSLKGDTIIFYLLLKRLLLPHGNKSPVGDIQECQRHELQL